MTNRVKRKYHITADIVGQAYCCASETLPQARAAYERIISDPQLLEHALRREILGETNDCFGADSSAQEWGRHQHALRAAFGGEDEDEFERLCETVETSLCVSASNITLEATGDVRISGTAPDFVFRSKWLPGNVVAELRASLSLVFGVSYKPTPLVSDKVTAMLVTEHLVDDFEYPGVSNGEKLEDMLADLHQFSLEYDKPEYQNDAIYAEMLPQIATKPFADRLKWVKSLTRGDTPTLMQQIVDELAIRTTLSAVVNWNGGVEKPNIHA